MNSYPQPKYGHAYCPHCTREFDLELAVPSFLEKAPHNDTLVYLMCPDSNRRFEKAKAKERKEMMNACFSNVKLTKLNSDGCLPAWAVTTTLTLALNGNDYISAHEKGHGLSRKAYFSICSRNYKVIVSPFGLRMILTD